MSDQDVTAKVSFGAIDDELLPITRCVCGAVFKDWAWCISIYRNTANECPVCHRQLYFHNVIRVMEVENPS